MQYQDNCILLSPVGNYEDNPFQKENKMDKFSTDNKIDSSYTKAGQLPRNKITKYLRVLAEQIDSNKVIVDDYAVEDESGSYYFGIKFIIPSPVGQR